MQRKRIKIAASFAIAFMILAILSLIATAVLGYLTWKRELKFDDREQFEQSIKEALPLVIGLGSSLSFTVLFGLLSLIMTVLSIDRAYEHNKVARVIAIIGLLIPGLFILTFISLCVFIHKNKKDEEPQNVQANNPFIKQNAFANFNRDFQTPNNQE